jgi:hypothetical protein
MSPSRLFFSHRHSELSLFQARRAAALLDGGGECELASCESCDSINKQHTDTQGKMELTHSPSTRRLQLPPPPAAHQHREQEGATVLLHANRLYVCQRASNSFELRWISAIKLPFFANREVVKRRHLSHTSLRFVVQPAHPQILLTIYHAIWRKFEVTVFVSHNYADSHNIPQF